MSQRTKSVLGVIGLLLVILLCIGLFYAFNFVTPYWDRFFSDEPTCTTCETVTPTEPPVVTTPEPDFDIVIKGCPSGSLGVHPNTGEPLIYKANPYPGVVCEFELYYNAQIAKVSFPSSQGVIVEDWTVTCPTGAPCEGVWYQTATAYVPGTVLTHYWVFVNGNAAETRFPSHACEYVAKTDKGHTNKNIRVPNWALDSGTIFDHPGCPLP